MSLFEVTSEMDEISFEEEVSDGSDETSTTFSIYTNSESAELFGGDVLGSSAESTRDESPPDGGISSIDGFSEAYFTDDAAEEFSGADIDDVSKVAETGDIERSVEELPEREEIEEEDREATDLDMDVLGSDEEDSPGEDSSVLVELAGIEKVGDKFSKKIFSNKNSPKIIAILSENVKNGYPKSTTLFFKRLRSPDHKVLSYFVYRKNIFKDTKYKVIGIIQSVDFEVKPKYQKLAKRLNLKLKNTISFTDVNIKPDRAYAYKVETVYRKLTESEKRGRFFTDVITKLSSSFFEGIVDEDT